MAQWSRADRTLFTKVVYCGPALGGKTTNTRKGGVVGFIGRQVRRASKTDGKPADFVIVAIK